MKRLCGKDRSRVKGKFVLPFYFLLFTFLSAAQTLAPGGPGKNAQWATAGKQAIGTSATRESKVWFTLAQGVMTEVYYPDVTVANVHMLQFVVVNPKTKNVETERDDALHEVQDYFSPFYNQLLRPVAKRRVFGPPFVNPDDTASLRFRQTNTAKSGEWKITKDYVTDPKRSTVLINVQFETKNKDLELYIYYDPSLSNTGMHDTAWSDGQSLLACDGTICSALTANGLSELSSGYYQTSDGLEQLRRYGKINGPFGRAENGNVVQISKVGPKGKNLGIFTVALGFGVSSAEAQTTAETSLRRGFVGPFNEYVKGWSDYVKTLPKVDSKYQAQFNMAAMVLKAQEDKTVRGANVASLTIPWGGGANANEDVGGGYHLVWARDLYHVFTAYMALGDKAAAERALDFLFKIQQKEDGSFPQNSWLDGKRGWGSLQMDEVGYPLIMAWQLGRFDKETYEKHVKRAADFIVKNGPWTPQERWEERPGYSPSTIAAEIAGLVCAADIAKRNGDEASALIWLAAADDWARNVERWTATTKGKYGDGNYYIRISEKGEPDGGHKIELNNNAGSFPETDIVDAGFLELVRLGIKPADDPLIVKSLKVIDEQIKVDTPNGPAYYRYTNDGYGEMADGRRWNFDGKYTGKGRPWPLLSGERGQYEIALCNKSAAVYDYACQAGYPRLNNMLAFANDGLMIPEQIWDKKEIPANIDHQFIPELKFGEGTGSATPLAWSMGQFIRLATNLKAGKNLDTPQVVYDRYKNGIPAKVSNFGGLDEEVIMPLKPGVTVPAERQAQPGARIAYSLNGKTQIVTAGADGKAKTEFTMPEGSAVALLGVQAPDGATSFERIKILGAPPEQKFSTETIEKIKIAGSSPIVFGDEVIFFYRGKAETVQVAGDMTSWNTGRIFMQEIADGLFAYQAKFPSDARAEYKYTVDGRWTLDPLNSSKIDNGVGGENNFFAMPRYRLMTWDRDIVSTGKTETFQIESKPLGGPRKVTVYVPEVQGNVQHSLRRSNPMYPVMYIEDGSEYITRARAIQIQENLVKAGKIKPFIMAFVDPKDRLKEYWANDKWADFVANELVPEIDKRYRTIANRDGRALLGASLGGITSFYIGLTYPDEFSRIGGQSSSFWVDNERVLKNLEKLDPAKTPFRFYIDDGTFEGADDSRRVVVMLRGRGFPVTYVEGNTGHNWFAWRDRLAEAFIALMG